MALSFGGTSNGGMSVVMTGPFGSGGAAVRLVEIILPVDQWKGATSPYSQVVEVEGITIRSKVDLLPSALQLEALRDQRIAFTAENNDGVVTVYAVGDKPEEDLIFQAAVTEVTL